MRALKALTRAYTSTLYLCTAHTVKSRSTDVRQRLLQLLAHEPHHRLPVHPCSSALDLVDELFHLLLTWARHARTLGLSICLRVDRDVVMLKCAWRHSRVTLSQVIYLVAISLRAATVQKK